MPETHGTPCPELKKLMEIVEKHEQRLGRGNIEFAVISTKLNIIMAILAVVLCANYLLSYKPTVGDNDKNTYIVTDEKGNRQVITLKNKEGNYNFLVLGHDRAALLM